MVEYFDVECECCKTRGQIAKSETEGCDYRCIYEFSNGWISIAVQELPDTAGRTLPECLPICGAQRLAGG